ncbi:MAG: stress response translation initiation inhibitor YciH [Candidatus Thermoplasmatota archaeon]|nr:stress response translation initiation inhibitor YciH [Euryarchaeota archaeon]MBU4031939.1 stress response translation initiation inhibitor YciH [Candidatus Thermoplasmatota archaeon]MBU4072481.1 stress response translation initiation inhibitor YciH [Candidatus Thermoplasmatota archaeon]MBU4144179.1 stress response translation initiation inhibitor YciH [Candidatus Thermoplasmatota archaeon]MBU4592813.1 stress response translation initiation inhibitor YciH [Candidatus Thermoplasmatota archaeo
MAGICSVCGLPEELCMCEEIAREQQQIIIRSDKRRYGKIVTVVTGINTSDINVDELARTLKTKCAAGGTIKGGNIELQGDHVKKVQKVLAEMGFKVGLKGDGA